MPNLRVLDFHKVKLKERLLAKNLFESEKGRQLIDDMRNKKFQAEEDEEYIKEFEKTFQDEEKKRKIYVNYFLITNFLEFNKKFKFFGKNKKIREISSNGKYRKRFFKS